MYAEDRVPGSISDEIRSPTVFSDVKVTVAA